MSLAQYYAAPSLDGFIADADNSLDWLLTRKTDDDGPLSFRECMAGVGAMAMGTTTYEWILDQEPADDTLAGVDVAPQGPLLGLHPPGIAGRPRRAGRVHQRGHRTQRRLRRGKVLRCAVTDMESTPQRTSADLVVAGLLGHAAWDAYHHRVNRVVVRSLAEFCLALDTVLAVVIVTMRR